MKTIGDFFERRQTDSSNNFLILRLAAASLVIYGHAPAMSATCVTCQDFVAAFGYRYSGDVALQIFFVISGFLVYASFDKRQSLKNFLVSRALRIFPALWVCLIVCILVGSMFTTASILDYFSAAETHRYLILNGTLYQGQFTLPGVVYSHHPVYGASINGSIWSLFAEVRLYLAVAIAGAFGIIGRRLLSNVSLAVIVLIGIFEPARMPLIGDNPDNLRLGAFFAAGVFAYINRYSIPLKIEILGLLILATIISKHSLNFEVFAGASLAYGTLLFGLSKKITAPLEDYSYGIYLYGWPVTQLVAHFFPDIGPRSLTIIAVPLAWCLGFLSWHLIEKRAMRLKRIGSKLQTEHAIRLPHSHPESDILIESFLSHSTAAARKKSST